MSGCAGVLACYIMSGYAGVLACYYVQVRRRPRLLNYLPPPKKNCHFVSLTLTNPVWHKV